MTITRIDILRDGGTILFRVEEPPHLAGQYRLPTPFDGEPRPLFRNEVSFELGSAAEMAIAAALRGWLDAAIASPDVSQAFRELDDLHEWRNLPERLIRAVPLHRIRYVIRYLDGRRGA